MHEIQVGPVWLRSDEQHVQCSRLPDRRKFPRLSGVRGEMAVRPRAWGSRSNDSWSTAPGILMLKTSLPD